jgi:iron complex transport system permease protein
MVFSMLKNIRTVTFVFICAAMAFFLGASIVLAIHIGAVDLTPEWVFQILVNHLAGREVYPVAWPGYADGIVWGMRLPKVIVAACVGAGLSLVGIMMQAMTKNSMADPYLLGISSGASAGATAAILVGSLPLIGSVSVQGGAFLGAIVSSVLVFLLAGASGRVSSTRLILSGTAVSALFSMPAYDRTEEVNYTHPCGMSETHILWMWLLRSVEIASFEPEYSLRLPVMLKGGHTPAIPFSTDAY